MLEIEIKAYCENPDEIVKKIVSMGYTKIENREEKDLYFKHPLRNFEETDEALRIRAANDSYILTYKGPKIGDKTKTRFEEEVEFNEIESMKTILLKLGFKTVEEVKKNRTIYKKDDIEICIDIVEGIGSFIELEIKDNDQVNGEKKLFRLAEELDLKKFERRSYLELKLSG